ncbi:MAG: DNA-binding response regulator, partial [Flavobacterium johnsoniae]
MNILVAEDEIGISNFLKQGLEEENYTVTVASDGEKALRLALSQPFDLLLLDWMLPKLSGIEVCKSFRKT